jgi:branched-chain amino acid transport system substrate-binding protein
MPDTPVRIVFCFDFSGPYQNVDGPAGAEAIRMAIEDIGGSASGCSVELLLGDHRNDEREAGSIARRWFTEQGVDMVPCVAGIAADRETHELR